MPTDAAALGSPAPRPPRCLVLGGTGYVGAAVVRTLHRQGARVAFTWHSNQAGARALERDCPGSRAFPADLADFAAARGVVATAAAHLGGLDVLAQCAGQRGDPGLYTHAHGGEHRKLLEVDAGAFHDLWAVTVASTFAACQEATPHLIAAGGGSIVIVGSMDGVKPLPAPVHYATVKGALRSMTEALAKELGNDRIRVNLVAPGILEGGIAKHLAPDLLADYLAHCSLGRVGRADEVADLVAWLALENTYVTAQSILLDGGL